MFAWRMPRLIRQRGAAGAPRRVAGRSAKCAAPLAVLAFFTQVTGGASHTCPGKDAASGATRVAGEAAPGGRESAHRKSISAPVIAKHWVAAAPAPLAEKTSGFHVNRGLRDLRNEGIAEFHYRRLLILNPDELVDAAGISRRAALPWIDAAASVRPDLTRAGVPVHDRFRKPAAANDSRTI